LDYLKQHPEKANTTIFWESKSVVQPLGTDSWEKLQKIMNNNKKVEAWVHKSGFRQEEEYKNKVSVLEAKAQDSSLSTVQKSKAVNELAQLKGEDPLPLRKAKITQEAALRKVEKERKAAEAATAAANKKAEASAAAQKAAEEQAEKSEAARVATEGKSKEVEAAVVETQTKFDEAVATLEALKKKSGSAQGALWWLSKEVEEARKWLAPKKST